MRCILGQKWFERDPQNVARELLGMYLVRSLNGTIEAYQIMETEAYGGEEDLGSHASKGRTARTEVMYGEAGHWYVYLVYRVHEMLNIVTGRRNHPSGVLIRAVAGINGPGKLTRRLRIGRELNAARAVPESGLWIEDRGVRYPDRDIAQTPRIGVEYAGAWAQKPWRFVAKKKSEVTE